MRKRPSKPGFILHLQNISRQTCRDYKQGPQRVTDSHGNSDNYRHYYLQYSILSHALVPGGTDCLEIQYISENAKKDNLCHRAPVRGILVGEKHSTSVRVCGRFYWPSLQITSSAYLTTFDSYGQGYRFRTFAPKCKTSINWNDENGQLRHRNG